MGRKEEGRRKEEGDKGDGGGRMCGKPLQERRLGGDEWEGIKVT